MIIPDKEFQYLCVGGRSHQCGFIVIQEVFVNELGLEWL